MSKNESSSSSTSDSTSESEKAQPVASAVQAEKKLVDVSKLKPESSSSEESASEESEDSKNDATEELPRSSGAAKVNKTVEADVIQKPVKVGKVDGKRVTFTDPPVVELHNSVHKGHASVGDKSLSGRKEDLTAASSEKKRAASAPEIAAANLKRARKSSASAFRSPCTPHIWLPSEEILLAKALQRASEFGSKFPKEKGSKYWQSMMEILDISDPPLSLSQFHQKIRRMKSKYLSLRGRASSFSTAWKESHEGQLFKLWDRSWGKGSVNSICTDKDFEDEYDDDVHTTQSAHLRSSDSEEDDKVLAEVKSARPKITIYPRSVRSDQQFVIHFDGSSLLNPTRAPVDCSKVLPEHKDTPPELRRSLLQIRKKCCDLYCEEMSTTENILKSIVQRCELERRRSLLNYEIEEFYARFPVRSL
ncbi:protein MpGEBP3 [Marchantia polymorpha subsp. ruderalis]|uniref:Uncharacterized protein n=2 Tax=Marchantia polymorpha TaxID=3197 RepID=A0AAF6BDC6_MARPO|nr:hypothetical protein MARPO_0078s0020 [Marchantia polymorpha]BBN10010.1 hypothetical protein Mp_5g00190 [Marchantia polymorpha subsp. ruderalis]|eukprot:PTQ34604.1 hypothetical protein MARPO_0078s0020 [Marchantia polymorpha]